MVRPYTKDESLKLPLDQLKFDIPIPSELEHNIFGDQLGGQLYWCTKTFNWGACFWIVTVYALVSTEQTAK